jgi:outer membrane lipopolysaccharide assembly protein LptE/RlpB
MKPKRTIRTGAGLAIVLALAGCGFQLQGRQVLPPALESVRLDASDRQSEFTRALRTLLAAAGTRLVEGPKVTSGGAAAADIAAQPAQISILLDEVSERVLSVDARTWISTL